MKSGPEVVRLLLSLAATAAVTAGGRQAAALGSTALGAAHGARKVGRRKDLKILLGQLEDTVALDDIEVKALFDHGRAAATAAAHHHLSAAREARLASTLAAETALRRLTLTLTLTALEATLALELILRHRSFLLGDRVGDREGDRSRRDGESGENADFELAAHFARGSLKCRRPVPQ